MLCWNRWPDDPSRRHYEPPLLQSEPQWLHSPSQLLNFDFDTDPHPSVNFDADPDFHSEEDPDPASIKNGSFINHIFFNRIPWDWSRRSFSLTACVNCWCRTHTSTTLSTYYTLSPPSSRLLVTMLVPLSGKPVHSHFTCCQTRPGSGLWIRKDLVLYPDPTFRHVPDPDPDHTLFLNQANWMYVTVCNPRQLDHFEEKFANFKKSVRFFYPKENSIQDQFHLMVMYR